MPQLQEAGLLRIEPDSRYDVPVHSVILLTGSHSEATSLAQNVDVPLIAALQKAGISVYACEAQDVTTSSFTAYRAASASSDNRRPRQHRSRTVAVNFRPFQPHIPMISVIIPAYNEAERIAATLQAIRALPEISEIVVVDDGSTDDTAGCAEAAGADVVLRQANGGKGAALQAGFDMTSGDILLLLDADLGETAVEAGKLIAPLLANEAAMSIATFPVIPGKGGGVGLVVQLSRWGIRKLTGRTMQAPLSGQRAVQREVITNGGGFASGWGVEVALTVRALQQGYRLVEVPTEMTHRVTGRTWGAILHRAKQFTAAARVLWRLRLHPAPRIDLKALPPSTVSETNSSPNPPIAPVQEKEQT